ncbi:hypothetical protein HK100_004373, partial [Physocladia obscura]
MAAVISATAHTHLNTHAYVVASGIHPQAPVSRARLEEHQYNTLIDDLMLLAYCHTSPLAPSAKVAQEAVESSADIRNKR